MRKFTFLLIAAFMAYGLSGFGQVFITELADPENNAGVRYIELYNAGSSSVDFTENSGWRIDKYTNASATVSQTLNLTGTISAGGFYIIATGTNDGDFFSVFGVTADQFDGGDNDVAGSNGDDNLALRDGSDNLIDLFGVPGEDGSGTNHEFEDGRAERKATVTTGNTTYTFDEWNIWNDTGGSGTTNDPQDAPDDFDPGAWIGAPTSDPLITISTTSLTGFSYLIGNGPSEEQSFTAQGSNLTVDINIVPPTNYEISTGTGGSFSATNPITLTQSEGTVSSTTIYTRLKAGLSAGDYNNEDITATSTGATNKTVTCSGTVEAPATTTLPYSETFDADLGDCYTYSVSGSTKVWYWGSGGYAAMSGYNSGELEEDWLILPGIDFDSYSNENMTFETWKRYGSEDDDNYLKLMYSTNYSGTGDPSGSTWSELAFTQPSSEEVWTSSGTVDLSSISGTSVYIALKYHYSSGHYRTWEVDDISITESSTDPEPTNYPTLFTATSNSSSAITNDWVDAVGDQLPAGYLVLANLTGTFSAPVDGTPVSDGEGAMNIAYGAETCQWTGLVPNTLYYFTIYPYTNSATTIDYKTDGTAPSANATTDDANLDLFISEVTDPINLDGRFIELYNASALTIDFDLVDWYIVKQVNGVNQYDFKLSGSVAANNTFVVGGYSLFTTLYGFAADQTNSQVSGNGDDGYYLYFGGDETTGILIDAYGVIGEDGSGKPWEYENTKAVRLRSVSSPNTTWTASEWNIPASADIADMTPSEYREDITWQGTTDSDWNTKGNNWSGTYGYIPDASFNVTVPSTGITNFPTISAEAACNNFTMASSSGGDASLMGQSNLTVEGTTTIQRYTTAGMWHGISSPLSGADFNSFYLNGSPNVWGKSYNELDNTYTFASDLATSLGDMKGWMIWIDGSTAQTFDITGSLRSGTQGAADNVTNQAGDVDHGYNFVGNPFPSAIDWDEATGWTKTNLGDGFWVWNQVNTNFASYSTSSGALNGGSQYISSGQGFFVQASSTGTLQMTEAVQVHNSVGFMKSQKTISNLIKLELTDGDRYDESIIRLDAEATDGFDNQLDMHKMFSYNEAQPQLYSTANNFMAINVLPQETVSIPMDVRGVDGNEMVLSLIEAVDFAQILLVDNYLGTQTNLTDAPYTFNYDATQTNRFTIYFSTVGVEDNLMENIQVYSYDKNIKVIIPMEMNAHVEVINLMGQKVLETDAHFGTKELSIEHTGFYFVNVIGSESSTTHKVFIK